MNSKYLSKFLEEIKLAFSKPVVKYNEVLRQKREKLQARKTKHIDKYIKPLDLEISHIESTLKSKCEHPTECLEVEKEDWYRDDGEGNSWSGDIFKLRCKSCGVEHKVKTNDDDRYKFNQTNDQMGHISLKPIWDRLVKEANEEAAKERARIEENLEREQYKRLKEKYG